MGEFTLEYSYTTDGKECINKFRGIDRKSTVKWEGDTLVIESRMDFEGNAVTVTEKWGLPQDGKTMTINRSSERSGGRNRRKDRARKTGTVG